MDNKELQQDMHPIDVYYFPIMNILNNAEKSLSHEDYQFLLDDVRKLWKMGIDKTFTDTTIREKDAKIKEQAEQLQSEKQLTDKLKELLKREIHDKTYQVHYDAYKSEDGAKEWSDNAVEYFFKQHGI